ncbi:MAG: SDR family NAD(P)-dependent oxidoreductase [Actinomycetota bacterium]|nr:SDR family NAD(P)-dependent oxidoreductase [Actinomycetota bacterium]
MTSPTNRITTPFGDDSTAAEVLEGLDLSGRRMIVTGASSGIGVETARALAGAGAEVTLAVRNTDAGERTADDIATTSNARPRVARLDLADQSSVAAFVASWEGPLRVLVNNAGVMMLPELTRTPEGWEMQFATNHLGHFALAIGLHDALAAGGAEGGARIVSVSSSGHGASPVVFDDINFERREYDPSLAYGQSKTANALFAVGVTRRWASDGILANSLMPGGIWTNLQRHWDPTVLASTKQMVKDVGMEAKTPERGAATSVLLAASPLVAGVGGRYFEDCHEAEVVPAIVNGVYGERDYALDPEAADRLWDESLRFLG